MKLKHIGIQKTARNYDLIVEIAESFRGKKILEIGCGSGEGTIIFKNAGCKVIGIDIKDLRNSKSLRMYDFIVADGRELPFKAGTFDAVTTYDVIEHIDRDESLLKEAFRVTKRGGL